MVDDGSTDLSKEICLEYAEKNSRFKLISVLNGGVSKARNIGIDNAKGSYITFVDSDDKIIDSIYDDVFKYIQSEESDVTCFGINAIKDNVVSRVPFVNLNTCTNFIKYESYMNAVWNKVYSLDLLNQNNIRFNEHLTMAEDFLFVFKAMYFAKKVRYFDVCGYEYYINQGSAVNSNMTNKKLNSLKESYEEFVSFCEKENITAQYKELIKFRKMVYAIYYLVHKDFYDPKEYRKNVDRGDCYFYRKRYDLALISLFSSYGIDLFSNTYMKLKGIIKG